MILPDHSHLRLKSCRRVLEEMQSLVLLLMKIESGRNPCSDTDTGTSSSSSSSSSSLSSKKYDVFISFRGEDIRHSFISHLYDALCRNNIDTYIDNKLEKGIQVWPALVKAIEHSNLYLVVFSENYASSTWCLNELTKILECSKDEEQHHVIPVFYKIDPSHVQKQMGSYHIAFENHEHSNNHEQVQKWRASLTQAAKLSGFHYTANDRNEAELIGEIIKCLLKRLVPIHNIEYEGLVGIQKRIADVESSLCIGLQDVRFIAIWGMGGLGKTTLAGAVFNKWYAAFEGFCFLENVRQETKYHGVTYLKNKLFFKLLGDEESCIDMLGGESTYGFMSRLNKKKVLVVLDDVDDPNQVENLAGSPSWFGPGSRVIITTRDKGALRVKINEIYEIKALSFYESLELFNLNAFQDKCPNQAFAELSRKFVGYAKGLPLTLKVLGCFLYSKNEEEWNSQLNKLQKMTFVTIYDTLELSLNGLDPEEKDIFLDIACFFNGRKFEDIKMILDACGYSTTSGLTSLQDKALLTISGEKVVMHDLIRDMGWKIVGKESLEEPEKRSRLWNADDIYQVLKDHGQGSEVIRGITLDMSEIEELNLSPLVFTKMPMLKFLEFYDSTSKGCSLYFPEGLKSLSSELRYLHWDNYPLKSLPLTFSAKNLVKLEMRNSKLRKLWNGVQNVANLKVINLCNSKDLMELPDFSKALHLEEVYLSECRSLYEVHPSILSLEKLKVLELDYCSSLTSLKSDVHLKSLPSLSLSGCYSLKEFSIASENLTSLDLHGTAITELPSSIGRMHKLKDFKLTWCRNLKNLPSNLFDSLQSLEKLWVDDCQNISKIPNNICTLSSLSFLSIEETPVQRLPVSIKHLPCLKSLIVSDCTSLECLPELPPSIEEVKAVNCSSLEIVSFTSLRPKMACAQFQNCLRLDVYSMKAMLTSVLIHRTNVDSEVIFPGCRVPEWFKYKTSQGSMTLDFTSAPHSLDWGIIFCFVLGRTDPLEYRRAFISDHVYVYYDDKICSQIHERIKRKRATSDSEILLKMVYDCDVLEIKEWGVCPTYASEYQNFINGMESEFEEDSASVMGDGWWDEIEDEEETVYPNHESSENSLFRFSFDASHPMELFGSIVSLCAVLEIVLWVIPANHVFGFTSRFIKLFRYSFLFFILLEIRLRLTHLSHEFKM